MNATALSSSVTPESIRKEIADAEALGSKQKRRLDIPRDVPGVLDGMLRMTATQIDAGTISPDKEEDARKVVGWAWANWNANRGDKRYQTLVMLAEFFPKEDGVPPVMVRSSFKPETVPESALRLLRLLKAKMPSLFPGAIARLIGAGAVTEKDLDRL